MTDAGCAFPQTTRCASGRLASERAIVCLMARGVECLHIRPHGAVPDEQKNRR
jgi:hypothetical protein